MPSREELNQLYSDSHKLKQVIADNNALRKQLAQQAEMVEKCMDCMNDNADEAKRLESVIVELQAALAEPSEPVAWTESAIDEYLSGYSLIGDDGDYTPTDDEKFVIKDAIIGFMSATPDCWDTAAYPTLEDAIIEAKSWYDDARAECERHIQEVDASREAIERQSAALRVALEALEETVNVPCYGGHPKQEAAITIIKEAL